MMGSSAVSKKASIFISPSNRSVKMRTGSPGGRMKKNAISRRRFAAMSAALLAGQALPARAQHKGPYLADMHSHYGMFLPRLFGRDLARHMLDSGTMLLAWAVTDDHRWIGRSPRGWQQTRQPDPGELWDSFQKRL